MQDKLGVVFTRPRDTISFFVGLFITAVGLIPLLEGLGVIGFTVPLVGSIGADILIWLVAIFGAYVLIDGLIEPPMHSLHWILIFAGAILMVLGLIPILHNMNVLSFTIPYITDNAVFYRAFLSAEGIALLIGGLTMH